VHRVSSTLNGPHATVCWWKANPAAGWWSRCMNRGRQASASSTPVVWTSENVVTVIGIVASRSRRHCRSLPTRCTRAPRVGSRHHTEMPAGLSPRPPPTGVFDSRHTESRTAQAIDVGQPRVLVVDLLCPCCSLLVVRVGVGGGITSPGGDRDNGRRSPTQTAVEHTEHSPERRTHPAWGQ
jgi:hypothetical protein